MWNIPIVLTFILAFSEGHVMFTNLKCEIIDKMFGKFETCHIKAINRTHKYMDVYVKLNKLPITNIKIIIDPMRNDNGYRPFFMSMTVDFCKYMRNPSLQKMTLVNELYSNIRNVSNLNHTCPYNNDIVLEKFWTGDLEKGLTKYLPIPNGQYALYSKWFTSNILRANLNVYFKVLN